MGSAGVNGYVRLVPRPGTGRPEVEEVARRHGWVLDIEIEPTPDQPLQLAWLAVEALVSIHWVENETFRLHYLLVGGEDVPGIVAVLRAELDLYDTRSLSDLFASAADDEARGQALQVIGLHGADVVVPDLVPFFRQGFQAADPLVRRIAVMAAANTQWRGFEADIERLRDGDADEEVRHGAAVFLDALREQWAEEGPDQ